MIDAVTESRVKKGKRTRVRFAAVAPDGRRSSTWVLLSSGSTKDDVYLSSSPMMGQVKVSFHYTDGYCQQGPTEKVRKLLPPGKERAALDRWKQPKGEPGVLQPAYMVYFTGSELRHQSEEADQSTLLIPSSGDFDEEIRVGVFFIEPPLPGTDTAVPPLRHLARLPLPSGAAVDLLWTAQTRQAGTIEEARFLIYNGIPRDMPVPLSTTQQFAYAAGARTRGRWAGVRGVSEFAVDTDRAVRLFSMKTGALREVRYEAPAHPADTSELQLPGRRYLRLRCSLRAWVEKDGPPIFLEDDLEDVIAYGSAPLDDRDEAEVADEVARVVGDRATSLMWRKGARPLMGRQTVTLPSGMVVGFCVLARPTTRRKAGVATLRSSVSYLPTLLAPIFR